MDYAYANTWFESIHHHDEPPRKKHRKPNPCSAIYPREGNSYRSRHSHSSIVPAVLHNDIPLTALENLTALSISSIAFLSVGHSSFINFSIKERERMGPNPSGLS
mmetsp:Transcript_26639/g.63886  ORF Transcript_26639/g.63886 Transcript_26639/m.63886 type:complete len:105 (+) Transcript_26639:3199-3513(+)